MTSFSSTDPLPNAVVLQQFFDWLHDLMHKCAGKDVHHNNGSIIRGAFEGFAQGGLEKLNTRYEMLLYTNTKGTHQVASSV